MIDATLISNTIFVAPLPVVWTENRLAREYRLVRLLNGELSLQMLFIEHAHNETGDIRDTRYEWRDIPTVELDQDPTR